MIGEAGVFVSLTSPPTIAEEAFDFDFDNDDFFSRNAAGNITEAEEVQVASTTDEDILKIFLEQDGNAVLVKTNQELLVEPQAEEPQAEEPQEVQVAEEPQVEDVDETEEKGPGKQGRPSTIAEGGKRENGPMANVDHNRQRPKGDASTEPENRLGQSAMGSAVDSRQVDLVEEEPSSRKNEPATGGDVDLREIDQFEQEPGSSRLGQSSMGGAAKSREVDPIADEKKTGLFSNTTPNAPPFNGANTRSWGARRFMGINRGMGVN